MNCAQNACTLRPVSRYVGLLRGINVGGKNLIKMTELKECFEKQGFEGGATYIQSGNVLFDAGAAGASKLVERIEEVLASTFNYKSSVVLRSMKQMENAVHEAPDGFGE